MVFILNRNLTNKYNFFQSLLLFSTRSLFIDLSCKLKVHRTNCQTIPSCSNRFSTDIVNNNNIPFLLFFFGFFCFSIFFSFFCFLICVFLFETKNIYSDTHATVRSGEWWKIFHLANFRKQDNFFFWPCYPWSTSKSEMPWLCGKLGEISSRFDITFSSTFH